MDGKETLGKCASGIIPVPVKAGCELHSLRYLQSEAFYIRIEYQQTDQFLAFLVDAELPGLFNCVDGIAACVGQADDLGAG